MKNYYIKSEVPRNVFFKKNFLNILLSFVIFFGLTEFLIYEFLSNNRKYFSKDYPNLILIENELTELTTKITNNNYYINNLNTNSELMRKSEKLVEQVIQYEDYITKQQNYNIIDLTAQVLEIISQYYNVNSNDYLKARDNLHMAKYIIEKQILNDKSLIKSNAEEIYYKLKNTFPNFPQTYSQILYSLGRSYFFYNDENSKENSLVFLRFASYLTELIEEDLGIDSLQSILIERNGLLRALLDSKDEDKILEGIKKYKNFLNDEKIYTDKDKKIILKYDILNQTESNTKIAQAYNILAKMQKDEHLKETYYNKALIHMLGGEYDNEKYKGTINIIEQNSTRKSYYYNILAETLYIFPYENEITKFNGLLEDNNKIKNNLDIAQKLYELSIKNHSFANPNYHVVSSYCDLAKVLYDKMDYKKARFIIDECMYGQNYINRPHYHKKYKATEILKEKIYAQN